LAQLLRIALCQQQKGKAMKKIILAIFLLTNYICQAQDSIGLVGLPIFLGENENPNLYWSLGPTFSVYRLSRTTVLDLGSNKDFLKHNSSRMVPGFCFDIGRDWKDVDWLYRDIHLNYGLKISYARRNKAVKNDYFETGQTTALFEAKQDVRDLRFTPYIELERTFKNRFKYGLSVGFGIGVKTLDNLKLYEKATNAYIGQRLKSGSMTFLGEFGIKLEGQCRRGYDWKVDYTFAMGGARYKRKVFIDNADAEASVRFQDQALLIDKAYISLPKRPSLKLRVCRFGVTVGKDF
jgi:hypothetical protein